MDRRIKKQWLLPAAVALLGVLLTVATSLVVWQLAVTKEKHLIKQTSAAKSELIQYQFLTLMPNVLGALQRMRDRWQTRAGTPFADWQQDAANYVNDNKGLRAVQWVDKDYIVRWTEPLIGNEQALHLDLSAEQNKKFALQQARQTKTYTLTPAVDLVQGNKGFLSYFPIFIQQQFAGFILGVFDMPMLIEQLLPNNFTDEFNFAIYSGGKLVYQNRHQNSEYDVQTGNTATFTFRKISWQIKVWPKRAVIEHVYFIPVLVLSVGLCISVLMAMSLFYGLYARVASSKLQQREAEREVLISKLQRSNLELDDFAYIASHDLKEPLRAIKNHSSFLLEDYSDKLDPDGQHKLHRLIYLGERMDKLISDLLYYSRLGREQMLFTAVDTRQLVADVLERLAEPLAEQNIYVSVANLPITRCDPVRVSELFYNLITNAYKYNDASKKRIELGANRDHKAWCFYVKDNGIGIDAQFNQDVFKIFKRLNSPKKYGEGSGAGLTFAKKIVEQHAGRIWFEAVDGGGTCFYFTIKD